MKRCSLVFSFTLALCAVAVTLSCAPAVHAAHSCGIVYDGLGEGQFDLNTQTATSTIAAHWFGFDSDALNYEWAVVSSALSAYLPVPGSCGQFRKVPDVMDWTNAHRSKSVSASNLHLTVGETYFVLVRTTYSDGQQVVASSDGVLVTAAAPKISTDASSPQQQQQQQQRKARSVAVDVNSVSNTCPIDAANRCRQSSQSVGALLQSMYGDPVFNPESPIALLFLVGRLSDRARAGIFPHTPFTQNFQRDYEGIGLVGKTAEFGDALIPPPQSHHDDDDGYISGDAPAWVIAPIAVGIFLCGLVVFLFLLVLRVFRRGDRETGGSSSGGGGAFAAGADASEKKDYAGRNNIGVANTSDRTDISFPDTAIRRLSITHNDTNVEDLEEATRSPRRKHPIMQSTSSSFRDYRNNT